MYLHQIQGLRSVSHKKRYIKSFMNKVKFWGANVVSITVPVFIEMSYQGTKKVVFKTISTNSINFILLRIVKMVFSRLAGSLDMSSSENCFCVSFK